MLTDFMQLLRCLQRLFMMQVHREREGLLRVSLIVKLLLFFQQNGIYCYCYDADCTVEIGFREEATTPSA